MVFISMGVKVNVSHLFKFTVSPAHAKCVIVLSNVVAVVVFLRASPFMWHSFGMQAYK